MAGEGEGATVRALDHVQVAAPRGSDTEERARAFYGRLLGLEEIEKPDALKPKGGVWFRVGKTGGQLHVGIEESFSPARKAHPALEVERLDALQARLEGAGYKTAEAEEIPGVRRFHVYDPFGNRIELLERDPAEPGVPPAGKPGAEEVGWRVRAASHLYMGPLVSVRMDTIEVEEAKREEFVYLEQQQAVLVVPVTPDGKIVLIRQYRYPLDRWFLEVVAGGTHDTGGMALEDVARKELAEEIGAECADVERVGRTVPLPARSTEVNHIFIAWDVVLSKDPATEAAESIEIVPVDAAEALRMAREGKIEATQHAYALLLCEGRLRERGLLQK